MPIVPTYDGPQLKQAAVEGGMQRVEDVSSGSQQLAKGLDDAAAIVDKIDYGQSLSAANAAEAKTREDWAQQDQVLRNTLRGERAGEYIPAAQKWWDDRKTQLGEALTPRARGLMDKSLGVARAQAFHSGAAWVNQEEDRAQVNNYNVGLAADTKLPLQALALGDSTAMAQVATANQLLAERVAKFGASRNWSSDEIAAHTLNARTDLNTEAVKQLATTDPAAARTYFDKVVKDGLFDSRKVDDMNKYLKITTTNALGADQGKTAVDGAVSAAAAEAVKNKQAPDPYYVPDELEVMKAVEAANKGKPNGEALNKEAAIAIKERIQMLKTGAEARVANNIRPLQAMFNKGASVTVMKNQPAFQALPSTTQTQLESSWRDLREHRTVQEQNIFDRERTPAYLEYSRPEVLSKMTEDQLVALRPQLGDRLYKDIEQKYTTWKKNDAALSEGHIDQDAFDTAVKRAGLEPKPKATDKDAAEVLKGIKDKVEFEIGQRQSKATRPLTREEKDKVMSDIIGKTVLEKPWTIGGVKVPFTGGTPVIQAGLNPTKLKDYNVEVELPDATGAMVPQTISVSSVPKAQFDNTALSLKRRKLPHTDADVIREWASLQRELATTK